jgi:Tol biopolymer transport system component
VDSPDPQVHGTWLSSLDRPRERKLVVPGAIFVQLTASGHVVYGRDDTVVAQPFDPRRGTLTGQPTVLASGMATPQAWNLGSYPLFSSSASVVAYAPRGDGSSQLVWRDRAGGRLGTLGESATYGQFQLSTDDRRVVVDIRTPEGNQDLWTLDVSRGVASRTSRDSAQDLTSVWSPDGRELIFASDRGEGVYWRIFRKRLDDGGPPKLLLDAAQNAWPESVTPDGKTLVYLSEESFTNHSIWALPLDGAGKPELLMEAEHAFDDPQVSPDGRWLAYGTDETGAWEVYVAPFRRPGAKVRVSAEGGRQSRWRGDSRELFYVTPGGTIVGVDVRESGDQLEVGLPRELLDAGVEFMQFDRYAVTRDGQRFLVSTPVEETGWSLQVILNWPELLRND